MRISLVVAVAENGVIGRGDDLPWRLRADLQRFRELTIGHVVIVGRKTQESIMRRLGKSLPGRRTVVLTRQAGYRLAGCETAHSLDEALDRVQGEAEVFVIGGAEIYRQALPRASRIYLTRIHAAPEGDAFFPPLDLADWRVTTLGSHPQDAQNESACTFEILERRDPRAGVNRSLSIQSRSPESPSAARG